MNVANLGQVFTNLQEVNTMIKLIRNNGRILEPSCGNGAISEKLSDCIAIELDSIIAPNKSINIDFFDYPISEKFDTIIGNPPYVRYKDILPDTLRKIDQRIFDKRTNLYMFFIYKCIQHLSPGGELIFITPRSFIQATCCKNLNNLIFSSGTVTDIIDLGDNIVFDGATPNVMIWRFEKDNHSKITNYNGKNRTFTHNNGQLQFLSYNYSTKFSDIFYVKVGGVSGNDKIFTHHSGNIDVVCSYTNTNGKLKRMIYNIINPHLLENKDILLSRKIKKFNENNWFEWGRNFYISDDDRIYVNCKTRLQNPFFLHNCKFYDGSILGIFPKISLDIKKACDILNNIDWDELGFKCGGRYIFSQKALYNTVLPNKLFH